MTINNTTTCRVRLFAGAAEAAGADTITVELPAGRSLAELVTHLGTDDQRLAEVLSVCTFLLNGQAAASHTVLPGGSAAVDVLPPCAGG